MADEDANSNTSGVNSFGCVQESFKYLEDIDPELLKECIQQEGEKNAPCYFDPQKILATKVVQRLRLMLWHHQKRELEDFTDFDFQIYTSRTNTLKVQTRTRVENRYSGCVPPRYYEGSSKDFHDYTDKRVHLYQYQPQSKEKQRHAELLEEASKNPNKLFLIVADEAHWGITGSDEDGKSRAHDQLINSWHSDKHKNVIVLLVTATAYNLLTEDSRLPLDVFCAETLSSGELDVVTPDNASDGDVKRLRNANSKDVTDLVGPMKPLHHVQWTETYSTRLEQGLRMTIRSLVTSSAAVCSKPIYLGPQHDSNTTFVPFVGSENVNSDLAIIVKGENDRVRLFDANQRQLAVKKLVDGLEKGYDVGFMSPDSVKNNPDVICEFEMEMTFGEDVFALYPIIPNTKVKLSLYYDRTSGTVKVHPKPRAVILGTHKVLVDLPVSDLFFIQDLEDIDDSGNNSYRYLSLNYYYNTIWNSVITDRKIRCDESFENICQDMLEDGRKTVHDQTDVFVAEYCIFVLVLSEFDKLLSTNSARLTCTKDIVEEIINTTAKIGDKIATFCEELKKDIRIRDEDIIDENAIQDVLSCYRSSFQDHSDFWKSILQACLFGFNDLVPEDLEKYEENVNCDLQTFLKDIRELKQTIISTYETGIIIADVMKMKPDSTGRLQGYMKVIRVNNVRHASRLFESLKLAREISSDDSPFLFEILRDYGNLKLKDIYQGQPDDQKYRLHLLLQCQCCATVEKPCQCTEYKSEGITIKCTKCNHPHNPVLKFEDLNGLPCIVILVEKGKMGDTFPPTFNCMDLRIRCPERKKGGAGSSASDFVLSSTVQEFGRLCRYNRRDDLCNIPYALVPRSMMKHLKCETNQDGEGATIYSSFLKWGKIDRHAALDRRTLKTKKVQALNMSTAEPDSSNSANDINIPFTAASTSFDSKKRCRNKHGGPAVKRQKGDGDSPKCAAASTLTNGAIEKVANNTVGNVAMAEIRRTKNNMILLDAEPQCGKTGTYCCLIAMLRRLICKEVSYDDIELESESSDVSDEEDEPVPAIPSTKKQPSLDEQTTWQYPYHLNMAKEKLKNKISASNKYTRLYGAWYPGKAPDKRPKFKELEDERLDGKASSASKCQAPYKAEIYSHKCSVCRVPEHLSPIIVEVHLNDSGYTCKLYISNIANCPQLVAKLRSADVTCAPQVHNLSSESAQESTDLKTWIFVPTAGHAKTACLNWKHTMCEDTKVFKTYVQILVVREEEFDLYCSIWGPKVTAILQLPNYMKNDTGADVSAIEGEIGYSRRFIQIFAVQLGLTNIFMLDDNVLFLQDAKFKDGKICRSSDNSFEFGCVPLFKALNHIENQFANDTPIPTVTFKPYGAMSLSSLETYTGPHSCYAVLGVRKARKGSQRVTKPFKKAHVYSLVLINLQATGGKNINYPLWEVHEDLEFNDLSDRNELWVCKYNRFLLFKKPMGISPKLYLWDETTELIQHGCPAGVDEVKNLASWISHFVPPKLEKGKYRLGGESRCNDSLRELLGKVKSKKHGKNNYFICVDVLSHNASQEALQDILGSSITRHAKEGPSHYIIAITAETCMQCSVIKLADFERLFQMNFKEGFQLQVATSHRVIDFQVEIVILSVQGEVLDPQDTNNDGEVGDQVPETASERDTETGNPVDEEETQEMVDTGSQQTDTDANLNEAIVVDSSDEDEIDMETENPNDQESDFRQSQELEIERELAQELQSEQYEEHSGENTLSSPFQPSSESLLGNTTHHSTNNDNNLLGNDRETESQSSIFSSPVRSPSPSLLRNTTQKSSNNQEAHVENESQRNILCSLSPSRGPPRGIDTHQDSNDWANYGLNQVLLDYMMQWERTPEGQKYSIINFSNDD